MKNIPPAEPFEDINTWNIAYPVLPEFSMKQRQISSKYYLPARVKPYKRLKKKKLRKNN
jgi:hypothetical protein